MTIVKIAKISMYFMETKNQIFKEDTSMFKMIHLMILEDEREVDTLVKLAANHHLQALYKVGVYGTVRQHELYVIGWFWNYYRFTKELAPKKKDI